MTQSGISQAEKFKQIQDVFDERLKEAIIENQEPYINTLKEFMKRCSVLQNSDEEKALPYLSYINDFLEKLTHVEDTIQFLEFCADIRKYVLDEFFPEINNSIQRIGIFTNNVVLDEVQRFHQLYMILSLHCAQQGYDKFYPVIEACLTARKKFYTSNRSSCHSELNPFGSEFLCHTAEFDAWIKSLEVGDVVDAVKSDYLGNMKIWSKAKIIKMKEAYLKVKFLNESDPTTVLKKYPYTPFVIAKEGTRSNSWEWRQSLKVGDQVDLFPNSTINDNSEWICMEVTGVEEKEELIGEEEEVVKVKYVSLIQINSGDPSECEVNVHSPELRKPGTFSEIGRLTYDFVNDECYEYEEQPMFAIIRTEGNDKTSGTSPFVHSKYFVSNINAFGMHGGFDLMLNKLEDPDHCYPYHISCFMTILQNCSPYLLDSVIRRYSIPAIERAVPLITTAPAEKLRNFTKEMLESTYSALEASYLRIYDRYHAKSIAEGYLLEVALISVKSDYLERKLHGVSILSDLNHSIDQKDIISLRKKDIVERIRKEDILSGIMKGHPQLISKSYGIFKMMFAEALDTTEEIELLWNTLRKGDLETKQSTLSILNDICLDLTLKHTEYIISNLEQVLPKNIHIDELEFIAKLIKFSQPTSVDRTEDSRFNELVHKFAIVLWKIATEDEIKSVELLNKATDKLITVLKDYDETNIDQIILDDAVVHLAEDKAVIQSLKVTRKIIALSKNPAKYLKHMMEKNVIEGIFENLRKFKKSIHSVIISSGGSLDNLTEDELKKYLKNERYTFEKHIIKRIQFIDSVLFATNPTEAQILDVINRIWEELVINSLIAAESEYFGKWFTKYFTGKESTKVIDIEFLRNFFYEKIQFLSEASVKASKTELLKLFTEIFFRINMLSFKIIEKYTKVAEPIFFSASYQKSNVIKNYFVRAHPDTLEGIDALWELIDTSNDQSLVQEVIDFVTPLYTKAELDISNDDPELYRSYMLAFITRCKNSLDTVTSTENWRDDKILCRKVTRILLLLQSIVDETTSKGICDVKPLSSFYRGDAITIFVDNTITPYHNSPKKLELQVYRNTTLFEIRAKVADNLRNVSWKDVSIQRRPQCPQIKEKDNGRNLRDLELSLFERLISSVKMMPIVDKAPLVDEHKNFTPRAREVFEEIFKVYSNEEGHMEPVHIAKFIFCVLHDNVKPEDSRVLDFIRSNGKVSSEYVVKEEFLAFYHTSCAQGKDEVVRSNLKELGYNEDLTKKSDIVDLVIEKDDLAGLHISNDSDLISKLFNLMDEKDELIASLTWNLFNRLPPAKNLMKKLLNFEGIDTYGWDSLIEATSAHKTMYYLYIIDFFMSNYDEENHIDDFKTFIIDNSEEFNLKKFKVQWRADFIKKGGFDHLMKIMMSFVEKGVTSKLEMSLFSFILKILKNFILAAVTINHPELYRNIAFIRSPLLDLDVLLQFDKEESESQVVAPETIQTSETVSYTHDGVEFEVSTPIIGPQLPDHIEVVPITEVKDQGASKNSLKQKLMPDEDFIAFRSSLVEVLGENPLEGVDVIGLLRLLVSLSEKIIQKEEDLEFETLSMIEHCLSISMSMILREPELLQRVILTEDYKLLPEGSPIKMEGKSDFISYFMTGLLNTKNTLFAEYFNHGFSVLIRECHSTEIQRMLLQLTLSNILNEEISGREAARYINLACPLLEEICSEKENKRILLTKSDIYDIIDLEILFSKVSEYLLDQTDFTTMNSRNKNELLTGYFNILKQILEIEPKIKNISESSGKDLISRVFSECLFNIYSEEPVKCENMYTRKFAYNFLSQACKGNNTNLKNLINGGLMELSKNLPVINNWSYTPSDRKKSPSGFVGIYNLQCICYMNAMLQQFYMTPAFRYGILAANDYEDANMVIEKDKEVDDNVFHQLKRMFAFLDCSERRDYNPKDFCFSFKDFAGEPVNVTIQQDTQEFLNMIFDKLENALKPTPFRNWMDSVYGGRTCNVFRCAGCGSVKKKTEPFYNISLEVKNFKNIEEGFEKFISEDVISDYRCDSCGNKCDYMKRCFVKELPNVLIVHLQRIIFDLNVLTNLKSNTRYSFPKEMNLKQYSLQKFEEDEEQNAEPQEWDKEKKADDQEPITRYPDEYFDYELKGVLVHRGSAEFGHYYSYINVNRNDPAKADIKEDKWLEFNDSSITHFKIDDLESECFGEGTTVDSPYENDYFNVGKLDSINKNRNAYILVYEKKQKKPLQFIFNKANITEKDTILKNLIKEDRVQHTRFTEDSEGEKSILEVDYYDIKKYIPEELAKEVSKDNLSFTIEQHVYSGYFLDFLTEISNLSFIPDFKPKKISNRIYQHENPLSEEEQIISIQIVKIMYNVYKSILPRLNDNGSIDAYTNNLMKIISCNPKLSNVFMKNLISEFDEFTLMILNSRETKYRAKIGDLFVHIVLVYIEMNPDEDFSAPNSLVGDLLNRLFGTLESGVKGYLYKRMGAYFKFWYTIAKKSEKIRIFMISKLYIQAHFLRFYAGKKSSGSDPKGLSAHEKALNHLLKTVVNLIQYIRDQSIQSNPTVVLDQSTQMMIYQLELYDKMLGENFSFNSYRSVRDLALIVCTNNESTSHMIINHCLKNLDYMKDNIMGYLELLKALALIKDEHTNSRRDLIFGHPCVTVDEDYSGKKKYGVMTAYTITKPVVSFRSSLDYQIIKSESLIQQLVKGRHKIEGNTFIMFIYFLEILNISQDLFEMNGNFHDFIFEFADDYINYQHLHSYVTNKEFAAYFASRMKESLISYEEKIRKYPHVNEDDYRLFSVTTKMIYGNNSERPHQLQEADPLDRPYFMMVNWPLVGCPEREENQIDLMIVDTEDDKVCLRVSEVVVNTIESKPTGVGNKAFPAKALLKECINESRVPENSELSRFMGYNKDLAAIPKPPFESFDESKFERKSFITANNTTNESTVGNVITITAVKEEPPSDSGEDDENLYDNKVEVKEFEIGLQQKNLMLRVSLTSDSLNCHAFLLEFRPQENCNIFLPLTPIRYNLSNLKFDKDLIHFTKIDPTKPFGDFEIKVLCIPIEEKYVRKDNMLYFDPKFEAQMFYVSKE